MVKGIGEMVCVLRRMIGDVRVPGPARSAAIVAGCLVLFVVVTTGTGWFAGAFGEMLPGVLLLAAAAALWFLPALVARARRHHQLGLVVLLSALGLIPVIGWITWTVALVVAAATPARAVQHTPWTR